MRRVNGRSWKQATVFAFLIGLDLVISLPIMGATYRPFSWMSIAPADAATLYPVIQHLSFENAKSSLSVEVNTGARYVLQRSTNILDNTCWEDVSTVTAMKSLIQLIDTNLSTRTVFYRVKQIVGAAP